MPSPQTNDSFQNGLRKIIGEVAQLSTLPDADLNLCNDLQTLIANHLRQGVSQAMGGFVDPNVAPPPLTGGGSPGMGGPGGPPPGMHTGGAMMGLTPGMPAVDELSRLLSNDGKVA